MTSLHLPNVASNATKKLGRSSLTKRWKKKKSMYREGEADTGSAS